MGVIVNKNNYKNDELSRRINADLRARALKSSDGAGKNKGTQNSIEDTEYVKDLKKTGRFGWVWIVLILLAILSIISIVFF